MSADLRPWHGNLGRTDHRVCRAEDVTGIEVTDLVVENITNAHSFHIINEAVDGVGTARSRS